jgi:hypothetical protein
VPDAGTGGFFGDVVIDCNKNDDDDGGDDLLQYFIASGGLSGSPSAHHMHHDQGHGHGGMVPVPGAASAAPPHTQHHHGLVSVLESIKRNLSFQAIDELYLLQPSAKRANYMTTMLSRGDDDDDHQHSMSSPTCFSISDTDEVF